MKKYPIYLQDENYSCGAYSIYMILKYFHIDDEVDHIKALCRLDHHGISMQGLIECLKYYHIEAKGYETDLETLKMHLRYPCILHTYHENRSHYIVLYRYKAPYFICGDPAEGLVRYTLAELGQLYQNRAIIIQIVGQPPQTAALSFYQYAWQKMKQMRFFIMKIMAISSLLSLFTLIMNTYFKYLMDMLNENMNTSFVNVLSIGVLFVLILKAFCQKIKNDWMITFEQQLQTSFVYSTIDHLLSLPMDYKERYLPQESLNKLQTLFELPQYLIECVESLCVDAIQIILFFAALYWLAPALLKGIGIILILVTGLSYFILKRLHKKDKQSLVDNQYLMTLAHHYLMHDKDYSVFKLESEEQQNRESFFTEYLKHFKEKKSDLSHYQIIVNVLLQFMSILLFYQGYGFIRSNRLTIGELMLAYTLVSYLVDPLFRAIQLIIQGKRMGMIFERYKTLNIKNNEGQETIQGPINTVAFDHVSFAFGYRNPIFEHQDEVFSHHLQVIGDNGSGKTTFLKLITGQLKDYRGSIKLNQAELRHISEKELKEKICFLNGEPFIASINVLQFLTEGIDQSVLYKLMGKFYLTELYPLLTCSLDGQGQGLSQGQLQLIAFVRVILLDYEMYVFDEAFSHMSDSLKQKVKQILESENFKNKLILVVDHQTNIVSNSESCVIISKGSIHIGAK
ncbi:MAG: cysteine peptidase family C39 domain-containing protein [Beduini sp.]|uniref:cysteine peptidase family C39 domain-containing protein n=1 Tax=Beduini sp. TaxID=1922300 RepID=UPI0039A16952